MKHLPALAAALLLSACTASGPYESYGVRLTSSDEAVAAMTVLHHPELYDGKVVLVEGTIAEVCPIKGCWIKVADGDRSMHVNFKDYAIFLPKDSAGRTVRLHGQVAMREIPADEARHYLEDAGRHDEAAKITGPARQLTMVADGVLLYPEPKAAN
jgi:hypothetical protein